MSQDRISERTNRSFLKRRLAPRVHIVCVCRDDMEIRTVSLPVVENDLAQTFRAAARSIPTIGKDLRYVVVIRGWDITRYEADRFLWLCGLGPDPDGKDKNWMGESDAGSKTS